MTKPIPQQPAVERISSIVDWIVSTTCALIFGTMTVVVILGVFFRYVLNIPLTWSEELARYLMIWGASLAISIGVRENEHVGLTIVYDALKTKAAKKMLSTVVFVVVAAFLAFMTILGTGMALEAGKRFSAGLGISMFLPTLAVPLSMVLALVQLILTYITRMSQNLDGPAVTSYIDI